MTRHDRLWVGLFFLFFGIWVWCFRGFLTGRLALASDAVSYYDHIQFFIRQLARGVFPLWDPYWSGGVPNEFFLRRFCPYNPFFLVILILYKAGLPYYTAYMVFLVAYYFFGIWGFFCLSRRLFSSISVAWILGLLLMFSSLGTRLFDSYLLLIFVPLVWFVYCLVGLVSERRLSAWLGCVGSLMLLVGTYIPFYAVLILGFGVASAFFFYGRRVWLWARAIMMFMSRRRVLAVIGILAVLAALAPGYRFMKQVSREGLAFPHRHATSREANPMTVGKKTITQWGMLEDLVFSFELLKEPQRFGFAVFYIPLLAVGLMVVGAWVPASRLFGVFWLTGMAIVLCLVDYGPVYPFLYQHVGVFKYFRNLHFFLWLGVLPVVLLMVGAQWREVERRWPVTRRWWMVLLLGGMIVGPSARLYGYLRQNVRPAYPGAYHYDRMEAAGSVINAFIRPLQEPRTLNPRQGPDLYYSTRDYAALSRQVHPAVLREYQRHRFAVADPSVGPQTPAAPLIEHAVLAARGWPVAVFPPGVLRHLDEKINGVPRLVKPGDAEIRLVHWGVNEARVVTRFPKEQWLVYNDAYHTRWRVWVDGKEVHLRKMMGAFKGVLVPAGEHRVVFRYGTAWDYAVNGGLMGVFLAVFVGWGVAWWRERDGLVQETI